MSKIQCFNNGLSYDKDNDLIQDGDGDNHEIRLHYRLLIFVGIKIHYNTYPPNILLIMLPTYQ